MSAVNVLNEHGVLDTPGGRGRVLDIDAIRDRIPHRDPFLFVRCAEILGAHAIQGMAHWPRSHPVIAGHFPSMGIVPGVCQIEAMAQLAGVLINDAGGAPGDLVGVIGAIRKAVFKAPLWPAVDLQMMCTLRPLGHASYLVAGEGRSENRLILSTEFIVALRARDFLASLS